MQNESTCSLCARHFMNTVEPNPSLPLRTLKNNSLMVAILLELSCSVRYVLPKPPCPSTRSILYFPPCKMVLGCRCCMILLFEETVRYNKILLAAEFLSAFITCILFSKIVKRYVLGGICCFLVILS